MQPTKWLKREDDVIFDLFSECKLNRHIMNCHCLAQIVIDGTFSYFSFPWIEEFDQEQVSFRASAFVFLYVEANRLYM